MHILWRRRIYPMGGAALLGLIALIYLLFATPVYTVSSSLYVQPVSLRTIPDSGEVPISENYRATQAQLITATPTLALAISAPGIDRLTAFNKVPNKIEYLKNHINVDLGRKDDLITVSMDSPDKFEGTMLVNSVVNAYINYQSKQIRTSTNEMLNVLTQEMVDLNKKIQEKNKELSDFRKEHNVLSLGPEDKNNISQQRMNKLSDELTNVDVEVLNAKSAYEAAIAGYANDPEKKKRLDKILADGSTTYIGDEATLRQSMVDLQQRVRDASSRYLPNHPVVQALEIRQGQMQVAYIQLMKQKWDSAVQKRADLSASVDALRKELIDDSGKTSQYISMMDELQHMQALSKNLDDKIKTADLNKNVGAMNITIVEEARPSAGPTHPNKSVTLGVNLLAGLLLGMMVAFFREWTDSSLRSAGEIEKSLGIAVLGAVPSMPRQYAASTHARAVHLNPGSESAEAYRSLRSAVMVNASARKFKTLMVTSPMPGDGKTTVACNLALAMAKAGIRVLLVDTHLSNPSVHDVFSISNERGLSTLLGGDLRGQVVQASGIENLDLLPSGPSPEDVPELLNSPTLTEVMVQLTRMYDMVIVDSAPVIPVVDGRIVAASCDASLLVLNGSRTDGKHSAQACDGLLSVGAEILGVVVNAVASDRLAEGFDVSYTHLGGYIGEQGLGKLSAPERLGETRSNP